MAAVDCYQNQAQTESTGQTQTQQQQSQQQSQQQQQSQSQQQQPQQQQATAGIPGKDDERKLFVGGLSRNTTDKELRDHFSKFGEIESISVKIDPYTGISRGFAFMVFTNPKTIDKLLASGEHYINKRKVDPKRVSKKPQHGKIFVGGLTPEITDEDIKTYFGQYGTIVELQAPFDKVKNQRKGFCFITFDSKEVVYKLLKTPKQTINGKEVDVKKVKVNPDPRNQGFWGPGYGYGYGGGYGYIPEYCNGYQGGYDDMYANYDYAGYDGYDNMGYGVQGKPRGNGQGPRQFQRHQPY
ncbi:RNA-binding protein squid-like [Apis laboriosa]|uniref:RNA-binding protein squid n=1 Tax=Apis cerana TaxID=7461 RepID=V9IL53_APICE|nr:RNA-binding protein squid-like [Apis dorsata]XP_016920367.1 RNA-binding protein squid [Apis cerana]XP_043802630.1 RNA-binding protein squid-like [Apis laboriosa]XP_043802631.1 RNA-binding protein squid-like [Apis laboriosa]KAG6803531.1 RNA-binding protein squid-like [Apis mellifera caucasica]KAG9435477.1 RNA-binding protein squid-like [Apis mellifera carnica]